MNVDSLDSVLRAWLAFLTEPRTAKEFASRFGTTTITARKIFDTIESSGEMTTTRGTRRDSKRGPLSKTFQATEKQSNEPR